MIFRQWQQVLTGEKTETRRVAREGETAGYFDAELTIVRNILNASKTTRYEVGKTYPVIPKMFQPAVWWREYDGVIEGQEAIQYRPSFNGYHSETDYENLTRIDRRGVLSELGFQPARIRILALRWREPLHDIDEAGAIREGVSSVDEYRDLWESINGKSRKYRWIANPPVNVIRFEVVRP
jgi:hypothetical protein